MACKDKNKEYAKERMTEERVTQMANRFTEVTGSRTMIHVNIDENGNEVYDFMVVTDDNGEVIYTDKM